MGNNVRTQMNEIYDIVNSSWDEALRPMQMKALGQYAADLIRLRTRLGYGVTDTGAKRQRLKKLSPITVAFRKQARKMGELSDQTTPGKSNLTYSGQLLDSIKSKISTQGQVVVGPTGYRTPSRLSSFSQEVINNNPHLANSLAKRGFIFNNISDLEFKKLVNYLNDGLTSVIKRRLQTK